MEANNMKAMREALCEIVLLCRKVGLSIHGDVACGIIASKARAALAAPMRNCDVGTAEEQENRFRRYCNSRGTFCGDCPLYKNRRGECRFAWAQMPYEEGGKK